MKFDIDKWKRIDRPLQFENIIVPDESFFGVEDRSFTSEYIEMIDRIRVFAQKHQTETSTRKIYFGYGRSQIGEERLAMYFKSKGYAIIPPERLTVDEQLNLLIKAESFASTIGSCSHNSIFLRDGAEVILIPRAAERFTAYQAAIDQIHHLNATYIDSTLSIFNSSERAYCFIISEQLKKFFGDEFSGYSDDDLKIFLAYVRNSMSRDYKLNENSLRYYAPMYREFYEQLKQRGDLLKAFGINLG